MVVNSLVVVEEDEEEIFGLNIWLKEVEDDDDDEVVIIFFLFMLKLSRWICMYLSFKGLNYWKMNYKKSLGMLKRERIRFVERGEERREYVMSKREYVKICSCFVIFLLIFVYVYI